MSSPARTPSTTSGERALPVNGVELCVQNFGRLADPPILLIGNSMLTWDDEFCSHLAAGGRSVVRYDQRDTGCSTIVDPERPQYTLRDLVGDASGLLDRLGLARAHVVGFGTGGWIAQLLALDHADQVASLVLIATRPTAPGPSDPDLPDHSPQVMSHIMNAPEPDWADRAEVIEAMVESSRQVAGSGPFDAAETRERVSRVVDRTIAAAPERADLRVLHAANQRATVFAALDCRPRWRERLGEITAPTLVIHGTDDPFFPVGNGEALATEIPCADLLLLLGTGQELPRRVWEVVVAAILRHTER